MKKMCLSELINHSILINFFSLLLPIPILTFQTPFLHLFHNLIAKLPRSENIFITVPHNMVLFRTRIKLLLGFKMNQMSIMKLKVNKIKYSENDASQRRSKYIVLATASNSRGLLATFVKIQKDIKLCFL